MLCTKSNVTVSCKNFSNIHFEIFGKYQCNHINITTYNDARIINENLHYYFVCFLHYLRYKSATNFDHVIASIKCFPILQDQFILHKDLVDS